MPNYDNGQLEMYVITMAHTRAITNLLPTKLFLVPACYLYYEKTQVKNLNRMKWYGELETFGQILHHAVVTNRWAACHCRFQISAGNNNYLLKYNRLSLSNDRLDFCIHRIISFAIRSCKKDSYYLNLIIET